MSKPTKCENPLPADLAADIKYGQCPDCDTLNLTIRAANEPAMVQALMATLEQLTGTSADEKEPAPVLQ